VADNTKYNFYGEVKVGKRRLAELIIKKNSSRKYKFSIYRFEKNN